MSDTFDKEYRRERMVRVSLIGLCVLVTLVWFIAAIVKPRTVPDNFTNSYSASPAGHRALTELLQREGYAVKRSVSHMYLPTYSEWSGDTLMVLEPRYHRSADYSADFREMLERAGQDATSFVLALPKRAYEHNEHANDPDGRIVLEEYAEPTHQVRQIVEMTRFNEWFELLRVRADHLGIYNPNSVVESESELHDYAQVLRLRNPDAPLPGYIQPLIYTDDDDVIAVRLTTQPNQSKGGFILVSDPDLFCNRFLGTPGMATLAMEVLSYHPRAGEIIIDEALHGFAQEASVEYLASTPPGLWVTLSVIALLFLFGWREATVLRPQSAENNLRDNRLFAIEGLGRMLERTGAHREAARRVLKRGEIVLSAGKVLVARAQAGVLTGGDTEQRKRSSLLKYEQNEEAELIEAARRIAARKRGES